jgi:glucokinase
MWGQWSPVEATECDREANQYSLKGTPSCMYALALDIGGTHIGCGVVHDTEILAQRTVPATAGDRLSDVLPDVTETLRGLLSDIALRDLQCSGIAIGFPGIVDSSTGTIYSTLKKFEDAPMLDLKGWASHSFGLPLSIENDARMALLGEHFAGAAQGCSDVVMMTLGTGIGSATLLDGRILRGAHAHAGCLGGHLTVKFDGRLCHCGNIGCAEAEASGWALPQIFEAWPGARRSKLATLRHFGFRELFAQVYSNDRVACEIRDHCLRVWSANAVSLVHSYDPEVVVVGGGVSQAADQIIPFMQEYIDRHTWSSWGKPQVRAASLGSSAALLGAVPLLRDATIRNAV